MAQYKIRRKKIKTKEWCGDHIFEHPSSNREQFQNAVLNQFERKGYFAHRIENVIHFLPKSACADPFIATVLP
jgi:hypothetical protein